jgi:hypothetical protein
MQIERIIGRRFRDGDPEKDGGGGDDKAAEEAAAAAKADEEAATAAAAEAKALADEEADKIARGDVVDDGKSKAKGEGEGDVAAPKGEGEGDGKGDVAPAKGDRTTSTMVPKSRLDTKNRMLSDAQARIEELEKKVAATVPAAAAVPAVVADETADTKIEAAEKEYAAARKDGNVDAELAAMRSIRSLQAEQGKAAMDSARTGATNDALEASRYEDVLAVIEEEHPQINPDSDEKTYDQDVVDEVVEIQEAMVLKGYSKSEALIRAVSYVIPNPDSKVAELSGERDKKAERDAAAKKKAAEAAAKQAPDTKDVGKSGDSAGANDTLPDAEKLSDEEFEALPETTKKRMRGDEV